MVSCIFPNPYACKKAIGGQKNNKKFWPQNNEPPPFETTVYLKKPIFPITRKPGKKKLFFGVRYKTKSGSTNNFYKIIFSKFQKKISQHSGLI